MTDPADRDDNASEGPARERTLFHAYFADLLLERGPRNVTFAFDLPLTREPQRADIVIMRKNPAEPPGEAQVLRRFWGLTSLDTVGEYKSPARPLRPADLSRLVGYGAQYHTEESKRLKSSRDLALALFVPAWTPTLDRELAVFGWKAESLGGGYYRVDAQPYALCVVVLAEVSQAEQDELLEMTASGKMTDTAAVWVFQRSRGNREGFPMEKLEGYEELVKEAIAHLPASWRLSGLKPEERLSGLKPEERLSGLKPEERLSGLKPEERLSGLKPEEQILALSDDVLAGLPSSYVETLPADVRAEIARRLMRH